MLGTFLPLIFDSSYLEPLNDDLILGLLGESGKADPPPLVFFLYLPTQILYNFEVSLLGSGPRCKGTPACTYLQCLVLSLCHPVSQGNSW